MLIASYSYSLNSRIFGGAFDAEGLEGGPIKPIGDLLKQEFS